MGWQNGAAWLSNDGGWYKNVAAGGGGTGAYVFRSAVYTTSASANAATISVDIGTASADRVVGIYCQCANSKIISSVVVDPTGANVTLTQDTQVNGGTTSAFFSGLVASGSGAKNIVITYTTDPNFNDMSYHVWTLTGLSSNAHRTAASGFPNLSIAVTAGHILLVGGSQTTIPWSSPTQVATGSRVDIHPYAASEDWASVSATGTFTATSVNQYAAVTFF